MILIYFFDTAYLYNIFLYICVNKTNIMIPNCKIIECRVKKGALLKQMRIKRRYNVNQFSILTGLNHRTINKIENGEIGYNIDSYHIYLLGLKQIKNG